MQASRAQELVHSHRSRIDSHIDRSVELLAQPPWTARYPLAVARWRLMKMLREYHLFKKVEIFDPAIRSGSPDQAKLAEAMLQACRNGWIGFTAYTLDWSSRDIVAEWPAYHEAMLAMAGKLHDHVAREERLVAELLGPSGDMYRLGQRH